MRASRLTQLIELERRAWAVALRAAVLPISTLIRRRDRYLAWKLSEVCHGAQRPGVYPEVGLGELLHTDLAVSLCCLPGRSYSVTETELLAIAALARKTAARAAFEIGTADGRTTMNLAGNISAPGIVYTLNLPLDQDPGHTQDVPVGHYFLGRHAPTQIVQLWGDSRGFDFTPYAGLCQLVFVDGDHFEPGVSIDSRTALGLVDRTGGIILWHDALRFDVQRALPRLAREQQLPVHLIAGTNLALLCFSGGRAVTPKEWAASRAETS